MPLLKTDAAHVCTEDDPCKPPSTCNRCDAIRALTGLDWYILNFYTRVQSQYINQTPMGTKDGHVIVTPRLEGFESALRIYGYPRPHWPFLVEWASFVLRVVHGTEEVVMPRPWRLLQPEDWEPPNGTS